MADPQDFHQFLKQDDLMKKFDQERQNIFLQKDIITFHELKDDPLIEEKLMTTDPDCIKAGKHLEQQNLFISTVDSIDPNDSEWARLISLSKRLNSSKKVPTSKFSGCRLHYPLTENSNIYERFQSAFERIDESVLSSSPENILPILNILEFSTSTSLLNLLSKLFDENLDHEWTAYTLASYYFRAVAEPGKAFECLKIALHLTPFKYFGVPLLSLANVLHQCGRSSEAQSILESALTFEPIGLDHFYFLLGQIYAVTLQHESSTWAFEKCLKITPNYESANLHLSVLKCHMKLEKALEMQHDAKIRSDLLYDEIVLGPLEGISCEKKGLIKKKRIECDIVDYQAYKRHKSEMLEEMRTKERRRKHENENAVEIGEELDDDDMIFFTKAKE
uniref:Uncharacterized protein n=1 Tax=Romanomermis culicivorax TaxID=13658 RepID=A0A915KW99_ROMCU